LVHLSSSSLGKTSAPSFGRQTPLSSGGREYVEALNEKRIFVDLAHISAAGFWQALDAHRADLPPLVTHTGVAGVHPHWRNLDDSQIRAIAERGGVIGIMYHSEFLGDPFWGGKLETVVRHLAHLRDVGGSDCLALGSDWDGAIITPRDMPTCLELPRLADALLSAGFTRDDVRKTLGGNFLRVLGMLRPG
jgi:membrane dipeptidase